MKVTIGNKIKLILFVVISIAIFITAIYIVGQKQQMFSNTFRISAIFKDISGLQTGYNVRFSGINVGAIEAIWQLTDSTVKIDMQIDRLVQRFIKKDAIATIGTDGLMGDKIVIIIPGSGNEKEINSNDIIETIQPVKLEEILLKLQITSNNAEFISNELSAIILNISQGKGTVGKLFMDSLFAEYVQQTIVNIEKGTAGFKENMEAASHNVLLRRYFKKNKNKKK